METSELDQEEIQKCKKRLDFIEMSNTEFGSQEDEVDSIVPSITPLFLKSAKLSNNSSMSQINQGIPVYKANPQINKDQNKYKRSNNVENQKCKNIKDGKRLHTGGGTGCGDTSPSSLAESFSN